MNYVCVCMYIYIYNIMEYCDYFRTYIHTYIYVIRYIGHMGYIGYKIIYDMKIMRLEGKRWNSVVDG